MRMATPMGRPMSRGNGSSECYGRTDGLTKTPITLVDHAQAVDAGARTTISTPRVDQSDHCPACQVRRELTEHRDNTAAEWSQRRAALNFARIVAGRACTDYQTAAARAAVATTEEDETP